MKNFTNLFLIVLLWMLSQTTTCAQVFVGAGYAMTMVSSSGLDEYNGFVVTIQKPITFQKPARLTLEPSVRVSVLNSSLKDPYLPALATTLGMSPLVSYQVVRKKPF